MRTNDTDLQRTVSQALDEMRDEEGSSFSFEKVNLAKLGRRTHLSGHKLRRLKKNGFVVLPNGNKGRKAPLTILTESTGIRTEPFFISSASQPSDTYQLPSGFSALLEFQNKVVLYSISIRAIHTMRN